MTPPTIVVLSVTSYLYSRYVVSVVVLLVAVVRDLVVVVVALVCFSFCFYVPFPLFPRFWFFFC